MVYGIIFTLGIIGNGLVVLIVGYQKTVKLQRISTCSISLSPTSCSSSCCPFGQWTLSRRGTSVHVIYTVNLYSSVLILAFVSLDRYLKAAGEQSDLRRSMAACCHPDRTSPGVCPSPGCTGRKLLRLPLRGGQRGFQRVLSAHLPSGKRSDVDGRFPLPAHPGGLRPTRTGHPHLLLYHHLQSLLRSQGPGAEEEETSEEDGDPRRLLLRLLVALLPLHLCGHPWDAECHRVL
ncbi:hypothetical protein ILYODFUR_031638 [Ilyodon furcidens]|uniref:Uncharacterized protein n=1 Tax=Ilyodon furcidens TaxID=33524 RepID=A0ABV0V7T3_9TELE